MVNKEVGEGGGYLYSYECGRWSRGSPTKQPSKRHPEAVALMNLTKVILEKC